MYKIAVVEDEIDLGNLVIQYLEKEGYKADIFRTGEEAIESINENYQLWILDIMLPGSVSGYDLIKKIKQIRPDMPVIFTSARDQEIDKIMGLELGSDDYVSKPYSARELMLRVRNIISRTYKDNLNKNIIKYFDYRIDLDKRSVAQQGDIISLTSKEFDLLCYLLDNGNNALSRDAILNKLWGEEYYGSDRVVDDLLRRLRAKMPDLKVETIYGYGYRLLW